MKPTMRAAVGLCLILLVSLLPTATAAAPQAQNVLTLQVGNENALRDTEIVSLGAAPNYASNGALMVPLRAVAELLEAEVTWDYNTRQAILNRHGTCLQFTPGSWNCCVNGMAVTLASPAVIQKGTLYVPFCTLANLEGIFIHAYGYYDGNYLVITDGPLSVGDQNGTPNEIFDAGAPDKALLLCRDNAAELLGPNAGLFDSTAMILRRGSRHAFMNGVAVELCPKGGTIMPYQSKDGYLMIPLEACAAALGASCTRNADGFSTVVYGGHTVIFPPENGYLIVEGVRQEFSYYGGCVKDGTAYCSVYAFATAMGLHGYADGATKGIVLTPYHLERRQALLRRAWDRVPGLALQCIEEAKGFVALTFDDGPSGRITARLLDGLKARNVRATFFLCNYRIQAYPELMSRYAEEGHELGNHSASHTALTACGSTALASELDRTSASIQKYAGVAPVLLRPPGGAYNQTVLSAAGQRGMSCILWSVDPQDWKCHDAEAVSQSVLSCVRNGDIILMHDMYESSVDAALTVIDTLQAQGYRFVTVSELAEIKNNPLQPGQVYSELW